MLPRGWENNELLIELPEIRATFPILEQISATKLDRLKSAPVNGAPAPTETVIELAYPALQRIIPKALERLAVESFKVAESRAGGWPHNQINQLGKTELDRTRDLLKNLRDIVKAGGSIDVIYLPYLLPEIGTK